jgi:predicted CoA-binding protein
MDAKQILKSASVILVIDWPSKDVPESLARADFQVIVRGGPGPEDYSAYELINGKVVPRRTGRMPDRADIIYSHRPLSELPGILEDAKTLHAKTIWLQSALAARGVDDPKGCWLPDEDLRQATTLAQAAGLTLLTSPYIGDIARELQATP